MKNEGESQFSPFFKGWAKPGPEVPGGEVLQEVAGERVTLDALCGHFRIYQLKKGHRYSTDDVLTAWYGSSWCPSARRVLDLGSGIGSVGMIAAWRLQGASFMTVEAQSISVKLARLSSAFNGLDGRYEIREGDFREEGVFKEEEKFDLVLGSPPYFPLDAGILGDHPQKIACRFEVRGTVADYCRVASERLALGGVFACIFPVSPPDQLKRVIDGARDAGLVVVRRRSVQFKEGLTPLLGVFLMMKEEHLPSPFRDLPFVEPPLVIRTASGAPHPEYAALKLSVGLPPT